MSPALGNRNYQAGPIALADYPAGREAIRALLMHETALVLLCVGIRFRRDTPPPQPLTAMA